MPQRYSERGKFLFNLLPWSAPDHDADLLAGHFGMFKHFTINPPGNTADLVVLCCVMPG